MDDYQEELLEARAGELDELAAMAADLCACPAAAIHFINDQYQYCKGAFALQREPVPLTRSLCARAILQSEPLITRHSRITAGRLLKINRSRTDAGRC